ncbi:cytochrome P450 [Pseudonocardia lutea]|uniref:Cytochrome P450 n=1 Tax=Pseudonocardia lutea TaxID=2172015 RepID=A0ABW1I220_9PSEU
MSAVATSAPDAAWVTLNALIDDPLPVYARLRAEHGEVVWVPSVQRYFVLGFEACRFAENNPDTFAPLGGRNLVRKAIGPNMLTKGDPEHAVERSAVNRALRPKTIEQSWLPVFQENGERFLADVIEAGPGADLVQSFAIPFAAANLAAIVGIPEAGWAAVQRWSSAFIAASGNLLNDPDVWAANERANAEAEEHITDAIARVKAVPDQSMLSAMVHADLPEFLVRANTKLAIAGGVNEPQHTIVNGVWAFARHPEQRDRLIADPAGFVGAFDEVVRWLSPIQSIGRAVIAPVTLGGVSLRPGDEVMLVVGAANRDPSQFPDPHRFDAFRTRKPHLAFGGGIHLCAGTWASKGQIGRVAWPLLHERLVGLRPVDIEAARWRGFTFRGLEQLPVTWDDVRGGA